MAEITYEIVKELAVLADGNNGWRKELNLVSWNNRPPKYDIREWSPEHERMGKGITLSSDEMDEIINAVKSEKESK